MEVTELYTLDGQNIAAAEKHYRDLTTGRGQKWVNFINLRSSLTRFKSDIEKARARIDSGSKALSNRTVFDSTELSAYCNRTSSNHRDFVFSGLLEHLPVSSTAGRNEDFFTSYDRSVLGKIFVDQSLGRCHILPYHIEEYQQRLREWRTGEALNPHEQAFNDFYQRNLEWSDGQIENCVNSYKKGCKQPGSDKLLLLADFFKTLNPGLQVGATTKSLEARRPILRAKNLHEHGRLAYVYDTQAYAELISNPALKDKFLETHQVRKFENSVANVAQQLQDVVVCTEARRSQVRDLFSLAGLHCLNEFLTENSSLERVRLVTRSSYILTIMNCLQFGSLNVAVRHPFFIAEILGSGVKSSTVQNLVDGLDNAIPQRYIRMSMPSSTDNPRDESEALWPEDEDVDVDVAETQSNFLSAIGKFTALLNGEIQSAMYIEDCLEEMDVNENAFLLRDFLKNEATSINDAIVAAEQDFFTKVISRQLKTFDNENPKGFQFDVTDEVYLFKHNPIIVRPRVGRLQVAFDFYGGTVKKLLNASRKIPSSATELYSYIGESLRLLGSVEPEDYSKMLDVLELLRFQAIIVGSTGTSGKITYPNSAFSLAAQIVHQSIPEALKNFFRSELGSYADRRGKLGVVFSLDEVGIAGSRTNNSTADALLALGPASNRSWNMLLHSLRENFIVAHLCSRGDGFEGILYPEGSLRQYRRCYRDLDLAALCQKAYERSQAMEETSVEDAVPPSPKELERLFPNIGHDFTASVVPMVTSVKLLQGTINWMRLRQMLSATQLEQLYRLWTQGQKTDFYSSSALEGQFIDASIVAMLSRNELDYNMIARQAKRIEENLKNLTAGERTILEPYCRPFLEYCTTLMARSMQMNLTCFLMIASFSYSGKFRAVKNLTALPKQDAGIYRNAKDWAVLLEADASRTPTKMRTASFLVALVDWFFPEPGLSKLAADEKLKSEIEALRDRLVGNKSFFSVLLDRFEKLYLD